MTWIVCPARLGRAPRARRRQPPLSRPESTSIAAHARAFSGLLGSMRRLARGRGSATRATLGLTKRLWRLRAMRPKIDAILDEELRLDQARMSTDALARTPGISGS